MSNYTLDEITKLVHKSNENNKSVITDTIKQILIEDDSLNIKLLEMVGNPVVVNPDKHLLSHAKDKNWHIINSTI